MTIQLYYLRSLSQEKQDQVGEYACWWRDGGRGYTENIKEAGLFDMESAKKEERFAPGEVLAVPEQAVHEMGKFLVVTRTQARAWPDQASDIRCPACGERLVYDSAMGGQATICLNQHWSAWKVLIITLMVLAALAVVCFTTPYGGK